MGRARSRPAAPGSHRRCRPGRAGAAGGGTRV